MGFGEQFVLTVELNRSLKDELSAAIGRQRGRRRISVTDLVNPRQAFFRRTRPEIQPSPDRLQAMMYGTGFHDLFSRAVGKNEFAEQFVEVDGVVGKIDIYEDLPTELKTTSLVLESIQESRPAYIDQLGMYCSMTQKPDGRLIVYKRAGSMLPAVLTAYTVRYSQLNEIAEEMRRRRDLLQVALNTNDTKGLPGCEWFEAGCDYEGVCGCSEDIARIRVVQRQNVTVEEDARLESVITARIGRPAERARGFQLNDLVFPRKWALAKQFASRDDDDEADIEKRLAALDRQGFYGAMREAVQFGVPGAFARVPVELRTMRGWVSMYRGVPTVVRSTRLTDVVDSSRVPDVFGHYVDRLAIECALAKREVGRIAVYYQSIPDDRFAVYDVGFTRMNEVVAEVDRRLGLLEGGAPVEQLPPCPAWMSKYCSYAPGCGCGRSKRT